MYYVMLITLIMINRELISVWFWMFRNPRNVFCTVVTLNVQLVKALTLTQPPD